MKSKTNVNYFDNLPDNLDAKKINKILEKYNSGTALTEYELEDLNQLLYLYEKGALSIRKALSNYNHDKQTLLVRKSDDEIELIDEEKFVTQNEDLINKTKEDICFKNYPCSIDFDGKTLKVYCPLTFKRSLTKSTLAYNYILADYIENDIKRWQVINNTEIRHKLKSPYICVLKRVTKKFSLNTVCDNDNLENQKIINTITRALGLKDNALEMDLYLTYSLESEKQKEGMYIYFLEKKNLETFLFL